MIVDSHCHAWAHWPYKPEVADPESRGRVEQLLWEMDQNGVDRAAVVCARLEHNDRPGSDNNDYIAEQVRRHPDRLYQIADVDCSWTPTYHAPGAAARLEQIVRRNKTKGFTHYVRGDDDGSWFLSDEGASFLARAVELNQVASLAIAPALQPVLRKVAERFPTLPILCHHMAGCRTSEEPPYPRMKEVLASARTPNIYVKMSGYHWVSQRSTEYPYSECAWIVRALYEHFGPDRLCWGSDYPVVLTYMTYRHSLDAFRMHGTFIPDDHKNRILGDTLFGLLERAGVPG